MSLFKALEIEDWPSWKVEGDPIKAVIYNNGQKVLVSKSDTINKHMVKVTLYSLGEKIWSVRFDRRTFSFLLVDSLLTRFYWQNIFND